MVKWHEIMIYKTEKITCKNSHFSAVVKLRKTEKKNYWLPQLTFLQNNSYPTKEGKNIDICCLFLTKLI